MNATLSRANEFLMPNYGLLDLEIYSGKGAWVWTRDANGKKAECLDLLCGLGVNSLGHCYPYVVEAIMEQLDTLGHVSNLYATPTMAQLSERLSELSGLPEAKVFFCNSGTEANEAAMKLARIRGFKISGPEKREVIYLTNSFHGRTLWSISATGQPKKQEMFGAPIPGMIEVPLNDIESLRKAACKNTCAVIFETIQAEGGINIMNAEFYGEMMKLSDEFDFLTIVDEVQTGIGRTGKMFSFERFDRRPDIITLAKALGGGLPIGAIVAGEGTGDYLIGGSHAATFGGNPIVCAAGLAVLDVIEQENLLERISIIGSLLNTELMLLAMRHLKVVADRRGAGCLFGLELKEPRAGEVVKKMRAMDVLIGTAGEKVVRIMPPFIIERRELDAALEKLDQVLDTL
jgi:predicted acetylornithine/succinylornithine family transaminase